MKSLLITESERNRILGMHKSATSKHYLMEQVNGDTPSGNYWQGIVDDQNKQIDQSNIKNRFGEDIFNGVKKIADDKGMTQVNNIRDDNSYYEWSKDLGGDNKLLLFLYNQSNDNTKTAAIMTYVDMDGGNAYKMSGGRLSKGSGFKMGSYPRPDNIYNINASLFNSVELTSEMDQISKMFQSNKPAQQQTQQTNTNTSSGSDVISKLTANKPTFKYYALNKSESTLVGNGVDTKVTIKSWNFKDGDSQMVYVSDIKGNDVTLENTTGSANVTLQ